VNSDGDFVFAGLAFGELLLQMLLLVFHRVMFGRRGLRLGHHQGRKRQAQNCEKDQRSFHIIANDLLSFRRRGPGLVTAFLVPAAQPHQAV